MAGKECYSEINEVLNRRIAEKKVLIAVHRGVWSGNIIDNTIPAYQLAYSMGADMFEGDVVSSTDGVIYLCHDGFEKRLFGIDRNLKTFSSAEIDQLVCRNCSGDRSGVHLGRLEDVFKTFRGDELYNIDRAWYCFPQVDALMRKYPHAVKQALLKSPVEDQYLEYLASCPVKYMYMPIASTMDQVRRALSYKDINFVGVEMCAGSADDELFQEENIRWVRSQGLFVWANTIKLGDWHAGYGGLEDDRAILGGADEVWGRIFEMGFEIIQTDWPWQLYQYRNEYFGKRGVKL